MKVYIIYERVDEPLARQVYNQLTAHGVDCWINNPLIGDDPYERRRKEHQELTRSDVCLLILSKVAAKSENMEASFRKAKTQNKAIFTLLAEDLDLNSTFISGQTDNLINLIHNRDVTLQNFIQTLISEPSTKNYARQLYLRTVKKQVNYLRLSRISGESVEDIPLGDVYISLPTNLAFDIVIQSDKITDWDISEKKRVGTAGFVKDEKTKHYKRLLGENVKLETIRPLVVRIQGLIEQGIDDQFSKSSDRPLFLAPPWYDGEKLGFWPLYVSDVAAICPRLVVLGQPGSGKSTFASFLTLCLLNSFSGVATERPTLTDLEYWPHGALTPIFIELRKLIGWKKFPPIGQPAGHDHIWSFIKEEILEESLASFEEELRKDLLEGKAIIILDGLDEIPTPGIKGALEKRRDQLKQIARELDIMYPQSRILFTSRNYGYSGWELEGYTAVELAPLKDRQMHRLAHKLFKKSLTSEQEADRKANSLIRALEFVPVSLKDRPLFLTLLATLFLNSPADQLPSNKGELYFKSIMLLLDRWTQPRLNENSLAEQIGCDIKELYSRLEAIAYQTHEKASSEEPEEVPTIDFSILLLELFRATEGKDIGKILAFLSQQSGVLISSAPEKFHFAHRSFQEFLAASYIVKQEDLSLLRRSIENQPQLWREPCLLVGDILLMELNG
jgi:hypothetical protein